MFGSVLSLFQFSSCCVECKSSSNALCLLCVCVCVRERERERETERETLDTPFINFPLHFHAHCRDNNYCTASSRGNDFDGLFMRASITAAVLSALLITHHAYSSIWQGLQCFAILGFSINLPSYDNVSANMKYIILTSFVAILTFWHRNYFFLILAHSVYKMWIIQEPNMLELWNKLHFEEK